MIQPWIARELISQRVAELERAAPARRLGNETRRLGNESRRLGNESGRSRSLGFVATRTGRALVAFGWRLGGEAALPATVRRRLA